MYVEDPRLFVAALADLAEPGGVSLVAKNAAALVTRPALEGNWAEALAAFDTDRPGQRARPGHPRGHR